MTRTNFKKSFYSNALESSQNYNTNPNSKSLHLISLIAEIPDARPIKRRRERLRGFSKRLRERSRPRSFRNEPSRNTPHAPSALRHRHTRKAALAMSAAALSVGSGAIGSTPIASQSFGSEIVELALPDAGVMRLSASQLTSSTSLKEALAQEEGVRLTVYSDAGGYATVGVGHRVTASDGLSVGDTITYDRAIDLLERDLDLAEGIVRDLVGDLPLFQHEFDALVDLAYNVGQGTVTPERSPALNAAIGRADYKAISDELMYQKVDGSFTSGLAYRSERRKAIFRHALYDDPRPEDVALPRTTQIEEELA